MRFGRYGTSYILIRLGLGVVFAWIGIDILRHPETWLGYVPPNLPLGLEREVALKLNGLLDVTLGLLFITDKLPRLAAMVGAAHLVGILVTQGIDAVIIRDVGLLGTTLGLLFWPHGRRRHFVSNYLFFWRRGRTSEFEE